MILSGSFEDTLFSIKDTSLTITGQNALLKGTTFTISSNNNVIRNLTIDNSNKEYVNTFIIFGNNNTISDCNITDYSVEEVNAIFVMGDNNTIIYNNLNIGGPSSEIDWDNPLDLSKTLSITLMANGNKVQYNNITTYSTISTYNKGYVESVTIQGTAAGAVSENNTVEYNNIISNAENNAYGVNLGLNVNRNTVRYNNITSIGDDYVAGVNLFSTGSNLTITNNNINIISTGKGVAIGIAMDNMAGKTESNLIKDNTAVVNAVNGVFIETNKMNNSIISDNTATVTATNGEGIYLNGEHNTVSGNDIQLKSVQDNAGIILLEANYTVVANNTVKTNTTYAVQLNNSNYNNVTDNYLESKNREGDSAVENIGNNNIVQKNNYVRPLKTTITVSNTTNVYNTTSTLTATVVDENNNLVQTGSVGFKLNGVTLKDSKGNTIQVDIKDGVATLEYDSSNVPKDYTITGLYYGNDAYESSKSTTDGILTITNKKADLQITTMTNNIKSGDILHVNVLVSVDEKLVDGGVVIFKLNGVTLKDTNGVQLNASVVNGIATFEYQIPVGYSAKDYRLTVVYSGKYIDRAEINTTLTLVKADVSSKVSAITVNKGEDASIYVVLYDEHGYQLERSTKVAIKANGKTILNTNTTNGVLNTTLPTSSFSNPYYNITIIFGENSAYNQLVINTTLIVENTKTLSTSQSNTIVPFVVDAGDNSTIEYIKE